MSGELFLILFNNTCYCIAYVFILSAFIELNGWGVLLTTLGLLIPSLLLMDWVNYYQLIYPVVLALVFCHREHGFLRALYKCFSGIFVLWLFVSVVFSLISLIVPQWLGSFSYNLFVGLLIVAFGAVLHVRPIFFRKAHQVDRTSLCILGIELLVIGYFQIIYPLSFNPLDTSPRKLASFLLVLLAVLFIFACLVIYGRDYAHRTAELQAEVERHNRSEREIRQQFETIIALRHYYDNVLSTMGVLIKDQSPELRQYFETNVVQVYRDSYIDQNRLERIHEELLRNLIQIKAAEVAATMPHIRFAVQITNDICYPHEIRIPVFEIVSIFLENALNSLRQQDAGWLEIVMDGDSGRISIQIANSVPVGFQLSDLQSSPQGNHGFGLSLVYELAKQWPMFLTTTRVETASVRQELLIDEDYGEGRAKKR